MPSLSKKTLSLFMRNGCERQTVFSLYGDPERVEYHLPPRQRSRPGLGTVGEFGYDYQNEKLSELRTVFGAANVRMSSIQTRNRPGHLDLSAELPGRQPYQFIVEARYEPNNLIFRQAIGFTHLTDYFGNPINIGANHPDILQILPSDYAGHPGGYLDDGRNPYLLGVCPDGQTFQLHPEDDRLHLRVIDVKLASEPGAHYFAEVVYYTMTLAGWLQAQSLDDCFVVIAAPAVWPGSHEASHLYRTWAEWRKNLYEPSAEQISIALEEDLEVATFEVFAPRVRRFLIEELPGMLAKPWLELGWHVDFRCKGCEFLGYPWRDQDGNIDNDPEHCWPSAEATDHLSRVFALSRGASEQLRRKSVSSIRVLAQTGEDSPAFRDHQGLFSKRTIFPYRAQSLYHNRASIISKSGGDTLMPAWPDLHIYIFLDYDLSTAFTTAIGVHARWVEPLPYGSPIPQDQKHQKSWPQNNAEDAIFLIDQPNIERERAEFLKFLRHLKKIMKDVNEQDEQDVQTGRRDSKTAVSTYQIYLWDEAQRKHLIRLIGRHLPFILNDPQIRDLAWLFPPPELLPLAEDATRESPFTFVKEVVHNTVAVPVPHYYRLIDVVQWIKPDAVSAPNIHPLYQEPLGDLLPAERIHEWWKRRGNWNAIQTGIQATVQKKVRAINLVARQLEVLLRGKLTAKAPLLSRPPRTISHLAPQSRLWLEYTRLDAALQGLEVHAVRAMPVEEREARLKSARLVRRLEGDEERRVLEQINQSMGKNLQPGNNIFTYELAPDSREVNIQPGDFQRALSPESLFGFLEKNIFPFIKDTPIQSKISSRGAISETGITQVAVEAIDRVNGYIVLRSSFLNRIRLLEQHTGLDFSRNVILDPVHKDFLTDKVELTVRAIGHPPNALTDERTVEALGISGAIPAGNSPITPAAEILWQAGDMCSARVQRDLFALRSYLEVFFHQIHSGLDASQWAAWEYVLSHRLSLIWGPPGTGKSHTLRAIVIGAVLDAVKHERPLRLLITSNTYNAVDNILLDLEQELASLLPEGFCRIYRVQSEYRPLDDDLEMKHPRLTNLVLNTQNPSPEIQDLINQLSNPKGVLILGCPPQQLHNLAVAGKSKSSSNYYKHTIQSLFDFTILDEASQMEVATSTLVFTKMALGGACVLAGDDLQLPPVQLAEPPLDLEFVVGSVYNYFRRQQAIQPCSLDINYRSNRTIVEFTKLAGYSANLTTHSPNLQLCLTGTVPDAAPEGWPDDLFWSPAWREMVAPTYPAVCFVYDDRLSSQVNDFEADSTAALLWLLCHSLGDRLENENRPEDEPSSPSNRYPPLVFWDKAVGVVTPHRVQMSKITYRLQRVFPDHPPEAIRSAVDTVERFQGQQRSVIIGSFGLGDPDIIGTEDEFLYNLNRFNVLTSRARAKVILFITRSLLDHLPDDAGVLKQSRLIKQFADEFCNQAEAKQIGFYRNGVPEFRSGMLLRRGHTTD